MEIEFLSDVFLNVPPISRSFPKTLAKTLKMRAKAQIHIFTVNTDGNVNFNLSQNLSNLEIDESDPFWGPHFYHIFFTFFLDSKSDPFWGPHFYHLFFHIFFGF